jgi:hypothetical protein
MVDCLRCEQVSAVNARGSLGFLKLLSFRWSKLEPIASKRVRSEATREIEMANEDTAWIARRAYALWEEEGRPDGRHDIHWQDAQREWEALQSGASATTENAERRIREARQEAPTDIPTSESAAVVRPPSPRGRRKD